MSRGTKIVNGYLWPESDTDCASVTFNRVKDLEIALKHCTARNVVIQAGGNTGVWPKYLAHTFAAVYTFEIEPVNFMCLVANCDSELNIVKLQAALGLRHKFVGVDYPEGLRNMGACQVSEIGNIPMFRVDDLDLRTCDLIQLDIEGYEPLAIHGAISTIRQFHPVLMIEDKGLSERYGYKQGWTESWIQHEGYVVADRVGRDIILVRSN